MPGHLLQEFRQRVLGPGLRPREFHHKTVVITGACGGIGRALALRFGEASARIALIDIREQELETFSEHLHSRNISAHTYLCDITDSTQVEQTFQRIQDDMGSIDTLINNAGVTHHSRFEETDISVFRTLMDTNYFGALNCTQASLDSLLKHQGQIITMSSMSGFAPLLNRSAYAASKHALHGLFDCLRVELREKGVQVMLVCPGYTATDIYQHALQADGSVSNHPLQREGEATPPTVVADEIFCAARRNRRLLVMSNVDWRARLFARLFPGIFERHLAHRIHGVSSP